MKRSGLTLGELVDSGIKLGGKNAFVTDPTLNNENRELILFLDGIIQNREKYESVFKREVARIYPKETCGYLILQIDLVGEEDHGEL